MDIGRKLKVALAARNMTIKDLSERSGIGESVIKYITSGRTKNPTWETMTKIADALGLPSLEFFRDENKKLAGEIVDLPESITEWIMNEDRVGYIKLAQEMEKEKISPEIARKLIQHYKVMMGLKK